MYRINNLKYICFKYYRPIRTSCSAAVHRIYLPFFDEKNHLLSIIWLDEVRAENRNSEVLNEIELVFPVKIVQPVSFHVGILSNCSCNSFWALKSLTECRQKVAFV